jgi:imidazolonepropionase-like amidohydrolase
MTKPAPFADTAGLLAVRAGRLLDVETGDSTPDRVLLVRDARIEAVLSPADGLPDGTPVVDLSGLTVLPGLIDTHGHLVGEIQSAGVPATTTTGAQDALISVRNARVTLEAGVTSVRDLGPFRAFVDCALRDTIALGELEGPRMQCSGAFITVPWGGGDVVGLAPDIVIPDELRFGVVRSPADVRDRVRRLLIGGADVIKGIGTGAVLTRGGVPGAPELSEEEMRAAVDEAALYGAFVAIHAHSSEGARRAVRAGVRSVEHGSMLDRETVQRIADSGTYLGVDLFDGEWAMEGDNMAGWPAETVRKMRDSMETGIQAFRWAVEAGVRITYSTDSGVYPHELVARQLASYVRYGMGSLAAIQSATVVAAECMGWDDRVGTLRPGRFCDLVAVDGDPVAEVSLLEAPVVVMKGGRIAVDRRAEIAAASGAASSSDAGSSGVASSSSVVAPGA